MIDYWKIFLLLGGSGATIALWIFRDEILARRREGVGKLEKLNEIYRLASKNSNSNSMMSRCMAKAEIRRIVEDQSIDYRYDIKALAQILEESPDDGGANWQRLKYATRSAARWQRIRNLVPFWN